MSTLPNRSLSLDYGSVSGSMESMLEKHGGLVGTLLVKKYWCVLRDGKFSYYKENKVCITNSTLRVQSVRLSDRQAFLFSHRLIPISSVLP